MGFSAFRQSGLTHYDEGRTHDGYTLITPMGSYDALLLDMAGRTVHTWSFPDATPGYGRLLDNGNLLMRGVEHSLWDSSVKRWAGNEASIDLRVRELGANASVLQEVDWDGNVVWQYQNKRIHHDFVKLASGNYVLVEWADMPPEVEDRVLGGVEDRGPDHPPMLGDEIFEIDPQGNELWRVKLWQLHDPVDDPICPLERRVEWSHVNSLAVNDVGDVLFSCRNISRVGIIDGTTRELTWSFGQSETYHQHHATYLPNGNIQIFDNGMHRFGMPRSRVIEVDPKTNAIEWEYKASPEIQFFSAHISGAERLPNGNVLICEGASGRLFEVTADSDIVWEWVNPTVNQVRGRDSFAIFRAHRYAPDHSALKGRAL
jgi:hypothetical protein